MSLEFERETERSWLQIKISELSAYVWYLEPRD